MWLLYLRFDDQGQVKTIIFAQAIKKEARAGGGGGEGSGANPEH